MSDISGFGLRVILKASRTYPVGVTLTQFADDSDPFDIPSIQVADKAMGLNGHLVTWTVATPTNLTLNMLPNTEDDRVLATLVNANRAIRGKTPARDIITLTAYYPSGRVINLANGKLTDGMIGQSIASSGRMKSKPYIFTFETTSSN